MLYHSKNFRELDQKLSFTEPAIGMFLENGCTFYDNLYYLIRFFQGVLKLKMSQLSIKGILEKFDKLKKSSPLRYMTNGRKN